MNTQGGGGTDWILPTNAWTCQFTQCTGINQPPIWTYAQLPSGANVLEGDEFNVSDVVATNVWGSTYTGTGTAHGLVRWNGTAWTLVGK